jgi:hypothetical protein
MRLSWFLLIAGLVAGLALWVAGVQFGIVIAAVSALGFVIAAWVDVGPQGGHAHDDGMVGRGVPPAPRITR